MGTRSFADEAAARERDREPKLSHQVYERIFELHRLGRVSRSSSRLPSESELSRRFGASRPIVREALARLRDDGLIVSRQGSGSYVQRRPDAAVLRFVPVGSVADIQRCFEFRVGLEGAAAALAAERWEEEDLTEIRQAALLDLETASARAASASRRMPAFTARSRRRPTTRFIARCSARSSRTSPSG